MVIAEMWLSDDDGKLLLRADVIPVLERRFADVLEKLSEYAELLPTAPGVIVYIAVLLWPVVCGGESEDGLVVEEGAGVAALLLSGPGVDSCAFLSHTLQLCAQYSSIKTLEVIQYPAAAHGAHCTCRSSQPAPLAVLGEGVDLATVTDIARVAEFSTIDDVEGASREALMPSVAGGAVDRNELR